MNSTLRFILRPLAVLRMMHNYCLGKAKHYYRGEQKKYLSILRDLFYLYLREGEFCSMYYALGLNQKGVSVKPYIGKKRIHAIKSKAEKNLKQELSTQIAFDVITKDKFYAGSVLKANGIPAIEDLGLIVRGEILDSSMVRRNIGDLKEFGDRLVIKNTLLEASTGVLFVECKDSTLMVNGNYVCDHKLLSIFQKGVWVIQKQCSAHHSIATINSSALNVLRIVTVYDGNQYRVIGGFQGFATGESSTDSWSDGSIYVGVDFEKGCLKRYGFRSPWHHGSGLLEEHPDSHIEFQGFSVPYLLEAQNLCLKAHRLFYTSYLLGWDVAITETGPLVVEVNENPGMNVLQCTSGEIYSKLWISDK